MDPMSRSYHDDMDEKPRPFSPSQDPWTGSPDRRRPSSTGSSGSSTAFMPTLDSNQGHAGMDDRDDDDFGYSSSSSTDDKDEDEFEKGRRGGRARGGRVEAGTKADPSQVPLLLNPSPPHPSSPSPLTSETGYEQGYGRKSDWVGMEDLENGGVVAGGAKRAEEGNQVKRISPWIMIPLWLTISASVIILNKHIFTTLNFPYPVFLTAFHMAVATGGTQLLRYTTNLLDQATHTSCTVQTYTTAILPLGVLFSASLVLSNTAYVYLSVSFVQMLKAFIPVVVHLMSWAIGLAEMDSTIGLILGMISVGCVVAAVGELKFSMFGFACQALAVIVESARLVAVQLLIGNRKLSPLVLVYLYAPLCFVMIAFLQPWMEGTAAFDDLPNVGIPILALSGGLAFALNVAGVYLIHSAGSLVLTLSGVLKDIILIVASVIVLHSVMTTTQILGYGIALGGLIWFKQKGTGNPLRNCQLWLRNQIGEERRARYMPWL